MTFERHPLVPESPWLEAPTLMGRHVVLEALRPDHAAELFHPLDDEEVWRSHKPRRDGTRRDSVFYGLLADEWPAAKQRLLARLAAHG